MAGKIHVNTSTGEVGQCRVVTGVCPFGGDTGEDNHFTSEKEARAYYESLQNSQVMSIKKPKMKKASFKEVASEKIVNFFVEKEGKIRKGRAALATASLSAVIIGGMLGGVAGFQNATNAEHLSCTVNNKQIVTIVDTNSEGNATSRQEYQVSTDQCGIFTVEANLAKAQLDKASIYSQIKVGDTYDFQTTGFDVQMLGVFPGIYQANPSGNY